MTTYIPQKHYKSFWAPKLYHTAYGGLQHKDFIEFTLRTVRPLRIETKSGGIRTMTPLDLIRI